MTHVAKQHDGTSFWMTLIKRKMQLELKFIKTLEIHCKWNQMSSFSTWMLNENLLFYCRNSFYFSQRRTRNNNDISGSSSSSISRNSKMKCHLVIFAIHLQVDETTFVAYHVTTLNLSILFQWFIYFLLQKKRRNSNQN